MKKRERGRETERRRGKRDQEVVRLCWTVQRNVNGSYIIFGPFVHHIGRDSGGVVFLNFFIQLGKGGVSTIKKHSSAPNKKHSSTLGLGICGKKASYQLISNLSGCLLVSVPVGLKVQQCLLENTHRVAPSLSNNHQDNNQEKSFSVSSSLTCGHPANSKSSASKYHLPSPPCRMYHPE